VGEIEGATVPPKPSGWTTDRMEINKFRCLINATGTKREEGDGSGWIDSGGEI
jgi:hypothetical protein